MGKRSSAMNFKRSNISSIVIRLEPGKNAMHDSASIHLLWHHKIWEKVSAFKQRREWFISDICDCSIVMIYELCASARKSRITLSSAAKAYCNLLRQRSTSAFDLSVPHKVQWWIACQQQEYANSSEKVNVEHIKLHGRYLPCTNID